MHRLYLAAGVLHEQCCLGGVPVSVVRPHLTRLKLPAAFLGRFQNVVWDLSVNPKNIEELPEDVALLKS